MSVCVCLSVCLYVNLWFIELPAQLKINDITRRSGRILLEGPLAEPAQTRIYGNQRVKG